ncbi:MAG: hypothetical protein WD928_05280 [Gammaproteobacteria bacterium]
MNLRQRHFVLTFGRSGSSLLCAILADAGADFALPVPASWDPRHGIMEHPQIKQAAHHMRRAFDIDAGRRFVIAPRIEAGIRRRRARRHLCRALEAAAYVKIGDLDLLVQMAFALGYSPRVLLNLRRFEDCLASTLVGRKHHGPDSLAVDYARICRQGLALMQTFGGCVVSYEDLLGGSEAAWIPAAATVTGLDADALRRAARQRVNAPVHGPANVAVVYGECRTLYETLSALNGRVFEPSAPVCRALESRQN